MKSLESPIERRSSNEAISESSAATAIQRQAAKLPSDLFLYAAGGSIAASLALKMMGRDKDSLFVGQWVPAFLVLGLYNKLVKLFGSNTQGA